MIITRTPFRISFAGGGSDLAAFYHKHEGCVLSASIDKYMYISIHPSFDKTKTALKYNKTEIKENVKDLEHPIARQILEDAGISGIEISSVADVPSGTGLASSSAFTVGLLHAVNTYNGKMRAQEWLAEKACEIEIDKLNEPIGKQDQYGCAIGGLKFITFKSNEKVEVEPILLRKEIYDKLEESLLLFYVGDTRSASKILGEQQRNTHRSDKFNNIVMMTELASETKIALETSNLQNFGRLLDKGWLLKKEMAKGITNEKIDEIYNIGIHNGAIGGKLLGAGGGGFLLFYCEKENQMKLRTALKGLKELPFTFDNGGSKIIYVGEKDW